jgi:DNA-binding NtrC family response regulator|tara:strand:+ start:789 stop:1169 length:381 start_codon:yes stop_codon:yes gene_type:complete
MTISIKVLIVDDEEIILEEASEALTDQGYECFVASGVKAAVEVIETTPGIRLILTDLRMPRESGADLIKMVEEKFGQDIKFIVMSGHASPSIETDDIDLELYPFLRKPLDIDNLIGMVYSVLGNKE